MEYRRINAPGGTFFFTLVTYERRQVFGEEQTVILLRNAFRSVLQKHPFTIEAAEVLPDHLHMIWRLPENDGDYATRWRLIKSHFTHHWEGGREFPTSASRHLKGERAVWQRRYWEHTIVTERDYAQHIDYIHVNPLKHGYVKRVCDWPHSTFHRYVADGILPVDWWRDCRFTICFGIIKRIPNQ